MRGEPQALLGGNWLQKGLPLPCLCEGAAWRGFVAAPRTQVKPLPRIGPFLGWGKGAGGTCSSLLPLPAWCIKGNVF